MKASELAIMSGISKATISRALRNTDDKGATYRPTEQMVVAISIAFKLEAEGYDALRRVALPEVVTWYEALDDRKTVMDTNMLLDSRKQPLLGFKK